MKLQHHVLMIVGFADLLGEFKALNTGFKIIVSMLFYNHASTLSEKLQAINGIIVVINERISDRLYCRN